MLGWLRRRLKIKPELSPRLLEIVDAVCGHVGGQISAFEGQSSERVPEQGQVFDLLIGAYVWGFLDSSIQNRDTSGSPATDELTESSILSAEIEVFPRLFGSERALWLRTHL